jgi:hypothetical protein
VDRILLYLLYLEIQESYAGYIPREPFLILQ